jgi:REP element-mobilizing transposase RayT
MQTFIEKEKECEKLFNEAGKFWHLYTDGTRMENIFLNDNDLKKGMISLAKAKCQKSGVEIITFEIMSNHIHLILCGDKSECLDLFEVFRKNLIRMISSQDRFLDWRRFKAAIIEIADLKALRNEIIYVNRNAFVANPQYTPFNYPWGGGWAYFSPSVHQLPVTHYLDLPYGQKRELAGGRVDERFSVLSFVGDTVFIPSFCNIGLGEKMFHNARSYFMTLTRNAEAFSLIASRLKDTIILTDEEIYASAVKYADEIFGVKSLKTLNPEQKIRTAKELHFRYNASNQQLRRILNIDLGILMELFP